MNDHSSPYITALDAIATENHLQMIKAAIPYIGGGEQRFISVYVKYLELMNTISFFRNSDSDDMKACSLTAQSNSPLDMLNDIRDYCSEEEKETVDVFINIINSIQLYQTYKETVGDEDGSPKGGPMDLLRGMLSPDQQAMFETYSTLLNT